MTEFKLFLPKFDGSKASDYRLWMCRLEAVNEDQDIAHVIQSRSVLESSTILDAQLGVACKKAAPLS
jgi:hypothetical protein